MKSARKVIRRKTPAACEKAAQAHIKRMEEKGWKLSEQFFGNSYLTDEMILYFFKG